MRFRYNGSQAGEWETTKLVEMSSVWLGETIAQEIRKDIDQWLGPKLPIARIKWAWELLQNAFDLAVRTNQKVLNVRLDVFPGVSVIFKHDGASGTFKQKEFFRLLTTGTTKDSESDEQEGRFGEGFVVTHVLSELVKVKGAIRDESGLLFFDEPIDRRGSPAEIADRITACLRRLDAQSISDQGAPGWTVFEYDLTTSQTADKALSEGLAEFDRLAPYIIAVMYARHGIKTTFTYSSPAGSWEIQISGKSRKIDNKAWEVVVDRRAGASSEAYGILVYQTSVPGFLIALPVTDLAKEIDNERLHDISGFPKLATNFPLLRTTYLPAAFMVFGELRKDGWEVDKDRLDLNYEDSATVQTLKRVLLEVLDLWTWLKDSGIGNRHLIFSGPSFVIGVAHPEGFDWSKLIAILSELAAGISTADIVDCPDSTKQPCKVRFPLLTGGDPAQLATEGEEALVQDLWKLASKAGHDIPKEDVKMDWYRMAKGWRMLGARIGPDYALEDAVVAVSRHESIRSLLSDKNHFPKLDNADEVLEFLHGLAVAFSNHFEVYRTTPEFIDKASIYCTQDGKLRRRDVRLVVDDGVSDILKSASVKLGHSLLERLLDRRQITPNSERWFRGKLQLPFWTDFEAAEDLFDYLRSYQTHMKDRRGNKPGLKEYRDGLVEFLSLLSISNAAQRIFTDARELKDLPFIWSDDEVESLRDRQLDRCYLPVTLLDPSFVPHITIFPLSVRLSDVYAIDCNHTAIGEFLVESRVCSRLPFYDKVRSLAQDEVRLLSSTPSSADHSPQDITLRAVTGFQTLLSSIGRGGQTVEPAKFLEFVLTYLAVQDESWTQPMETNAKCTQPGHGYCTVRIHRSEWILMLKKISWVPYNDGFATPDGRNLQPIVSSIPSCLESDAARRLLTLLGYDALEMVVLGLAGSDGTAQQSVRNQIASIAGLARNIEQLTMIEKFVKDRVRTSETIKRNQFIGDLVQSTVAQAFRTSGFTVSDDKIKNLKGHDFKAIFDREQEEEDIALQVLEYLVEVKETNQDEVRMTMPQVGAAVTRKEKYVLAVVDLRKNNDLRAIIAANSLSLDPESAAFQSLAEQMVPQLLPLIRIRKVGADLEGRLTDYDSATSIDGSGIRIEAGPQLRFVVTDAVWDKKAIPLEEWVKYLGGGI